MWELKLKLGAWSGMAVDIAFQAGDHILECLGGSRLQHRVSRRRLPVFASITAAGAMQEALALQSTSQVR